jgi:hypothetical protein
MEHQDVQNPEELACRDTGAYRRMTQFENCSYVTV